MFNCLAISVIVGNLEDIGVFLIKLEYFVQTDSNLIKRLHYTFHFLNETILKVHVSLCLLLASLSVCAQTKKISYSPDDSDFTNPERGFYIPSSTTASHFVMLNADQLRNYRLTPYKAGKASYRVNASLIYRGYELDIFKDKPLSDEFLHNLQKDLDAVKEAGCKMILRFAYTNTAKGGDCKDEYKICPPYGDAPVAIALHHIEQLKPLLQKNAAVIAVLQEGFIGIWGENYFTDYFGDASMNGLGIIPDSSWQQRNRLLKALLDALPQNRMVQVRTPQIKQKYVYGPSAPVTSAPLTITEAFSNSDKARIGFHNDCFLSTPDDYGTFYDYGSSSQPRQPANDVLRNYIEADTRFTAVGGETCDDAFSPQNNCAPAGYAEAEMRRMHYSFLNAAYNNDVNNDWDSSGCMASIKKKLGYRIVLRTATFPVQAKRGALINISLQMENTGYAAPFNPRPVQLVLRNTRTQAEYPCNVKADVRYWFTGNISLYAPIQLPKNIPAGSYRLFLHLPDADPDIAKRPEYAIRLANVNMWDKSTGLNDLHHTILVK
jgi:hypothetical protein